ncbi:uncharacterized protein LOC130357864 [Hyla sarda]|uniref:uncharacterized protein LOC130357864 n=1 Tax=Hyla sarda TaxID=327740 RepID=UPI0024C3D6A2|nr:uncharacterized protein LOC130357864 [Hyla sarda]
MAPARKKQRVQVVKSDLAASESHETRPHDPLTIVSVLKDAAPHCPSAELPPEADEAEQLNIRRRTYFVHGADAFEENEPCVIQHAQVEASNTVDEKIRRLTYIVKPFPPEGAENPLNCNPGIEMTHSEMEITGIQFQPSTLQDLKPKKRSGRKKKTVPALQAEAKSENADDKKENESLISNAPADRKSRKRGPKKSASSNDVQVKALGSENETEVSTVKAKGRRKKAQGHENETISTKSDQKKPVKRGKKKTAD